MRVRFVRLVALLLMALVAIGVCFINAGAQRRKRRPHSTSSAVASPSPSPTADEANDPADPKIVSTADQSTINRGAKGGGSKGPNAVSTPTPDSESEALRRTITDLSGQLNKLNEKLNQVEEQQRSLVDIERLNRAEQRAEGFRAQLRDVQQKETDIQGQLDQIEYALQPENIERAAAMMGTTHPEEVREQRRRQLESQRTRVKAQFDQLEQSRVRLETAVASADQEVEKLRARIDASNADLNEPPAKTIVLPAQTPNYTPPQPTPEPPR